MLVGSGKGVAPRSAGREGERITMRRRPPPSPPPPPQGRVPRRSYEAGLGSIHNASETAHSSPSAVASAAPIVCLRPDSDSSHA